MTTLKEFNESILKDTHSTQCEADSPGAPAFERIHTSCKDCVFATYDEDTQTGCRAGRLDKYRQNGSDIIEAFDNEKEFFVINKKLCNLNRDRNSEWAQKHVGRELDQARSEVCLKVIIIVMLDAGLILDELEKTAASLVHQTVPPFSVIFFNHQKAVSVAKIHDVLWKTVGNKITWRMAQNKTKKADGTFPNIKEAVGLYLDNLPNPAVSTTPCASYYSIFKAGFAVPPTFIEDLDAAMNDDMQMFRVLRPVDDINGLTCQVFTHQTPQVGGWDKWIFDDGTVVDNIVDKLHEISLETNNPALVKNVGDVCRNIQ